MARLASRSDSESRRVGWLFMFFVYILKSQVANKSYVGHTDDLDRRIKEHNSGKHFYTKRYLPWEIIYNENFENANEARKREKYLKTTNGRRFMKNIFENL